MIAVIGLFAGHIPVHAQTPQQINDAARAAEKIQQEQQERQRQQFIEDARRRKESAPMTVPEAEKSAVPGNGVCREIKEIVLVGASLLSDTQQQSLISGYLNRCLTVSDIESLLAEVVKAYIDRGYISVRPYVSAQDLSGGRLEILVVEGKVESINLDDAAKSSINLKTAFPGVVGKPLNLRDVEQGLDQVNRLASNRARMEIQPGSQPGGSIVGIANEPVFPLWFSSTADNLGSESTGRNQLGATLSLDSPLRLNDFLSLTHRESLAADRSLRLSEMNSLYYSVPYGYALFSLAYNDSTYRTPVFLASGNRLSSHGDSSSTMVKLDWVGYRDQVQKLTESIAMTQKTSKNYLESQLLQVSSRNLTILDLDLLWNRFVAGGVVSAGIGYSKGLAMMGALNDASGIASAAPHAQGDKYRYSASVFLPFQLVGLDASFSSQLNGQYALRPLYSTEQMFMGSYYTVRGFLKNSVSGDRAYYSRNELALTLQNAACPSVALKPYVGIDFGHVQQYENAVSANLSGMAAGVRISSKNVNGDISFSHAMRVPQGMSRESSLVLATITIGF
jgi:hemolysin activation/secretion protein